jgi:hypothetical protein
MLNIQSDTLFRYIDYFCIFFVLSFLHIHQGQWIVEMGYLCDVTFLNY